MTYKEKQMTERERCESCIHARPFGGSNDNRCGAWECEYINRKEAIEVWKAYQKGIIVIKELSSSAEVKGE